MFIEKNFKISEVSNSNYAKEHKIDNTPSEEVLNNAELLAIHVLQPVRDEINTPISISSWYRSKALNSALKGSSTSQHMKGEAVDFTCKDMAAAFEYIRKNLVFDQLIWEKGNDKQPKWIHVSYSRIRNRKQVLKYTNGTYVSM